jgi:hypothetical protein
VFHPLLHLLRIILSVSRTWHQTGKPQATEQIVNARERVGHPEFLLENALRLSGSQGADTVRLGRLGQKTLLERLFFRRRQVRGPARWSLGGHRVEAMIPTHRHPAWYESATATQGPCDGWSLVTFEGKDNGSIAISLFGILLLTTLLTQLRQILWMMKLDLHPTVPPVFPRVCQMLNAGATPF